MVRKPPRVTLTPTQLGLMVGITLLVLFGFGYTGRLIANAELQDQVTLWQGELALAKVRYAERQAMLERVKTDDYVIEKAHEDLGLTFPDEVAVWVVEAEAPEAPAPLQNAQAAPSWSLWWERFFGQ